MAIPKKGRFEKNNPDTAVYMLFNSKKGIYTAQISKLNGKCN